jgi:hypothetical protein
MSYDNMILAKKDLYNTGTYLKTLFQRHKRKIKRRYKHRKRKQCAIFTL